MRTSGLIGTIFVAFSVPCLVLLHWLVKEPTLVVIMLGASFMYLVALLVASIIFVAAGKDESLPGLYVTLGAVIVEAFRILTVHAVHKAEVVFRGRSQVLFSSRLRGVNVGMAIGLGFGLTQMLMHFGVLAEAHTTMSVRGATYFDIDICPQMPYLLFLAMLGGMQVLCHMCWGVMSLQGWVAWRPRCARTALDSEPLPTPERQLINNNPRGGTPNTSTSDPVIAIGPSSTNSEATDSRPASSQAPSGSRGNSRPASRTPQPAVSQRVVPPATTLGAELGLALVAATAVLHILVALLSLVNSNAYDDEAMETSSSRGCVVSLPVTAVVTALSICGTVGLARKEAVTRIALDNL